MTVTWFQHVKNQFECSHQKQGKFGKKCDRFVDFKRDVFTRCGEVHLKSRVHLLYNAIHSALIGAIFQLGQLGTSQQSTRQHQLLIRAIILWKSGCYWALLLLIIGPWLCRAWMPVGAKLSLLSMRDFPGRGIVHRAASAMRCRWRQTFDWFHKILTTWMRMMLDTS